uniref:SAM-dependent MTase TRM10-type domain-containing protein n=1 Tax=Caenorhabditis japonica TaxID=281687 RepID=A0A8R1DHF3_CAEJA
MKENPTGIKEVHGKEANTIYLSSHARDVLDGPLTADVIGVCVSMGRNREALSAARRAGIRAYRLPIHRYVKWKSGPQFLPFPNLMNVIRQVYANGGDWSTALHNNISRRHLIDPNEDEYKKQMTLRRKAREEERRELTEAILSAIDVVVVEQPNGEYKSTPFHVRFGKYGVFSYSDKYVDIAVNGVEIDLKMKLADSGVAFFVEEADDEVPDYLLTSPLPETETPQSTGGVDKMLAESARKLGETKLQENKDADKSDIVKSRSSSPDGGQGTAREPTQEQSLSQVQRKQTLPFSSSVFSDRRYRSLPDLTVLAAESSSSDNEETKRSKEESEKKPTRKTPRPFVHSHSQCSAVERKMFHKSNDDILRCLKRETREIDGKVPMRKKSRVTFEAPKPTRPIDIKIQQYTDSDSEMDSSVNSSPSPSIHDQREADRIADGALSDSEVDRQRDRNATPEPHDVTDWKWGELPETREQNKRKKEEEAVKATWRSWFWRSSTSNADNEKHNEKVEEEKGIPLDELLSQASSDPVNIEKYLGKPPSLTSIDSGNVSRGVSQPSSPTSRDDFTPTSASPTTSKDKTPTRESVRFAATLNDANSTTATAGVRSRASSDDIFPLSEDELDENFRPQYMQSLRLSSEKLKSLGLVLGANELRFSITTKFQGTTWCSCNIYLYKWYEQLVISDIDGTITKSDVLGHVIPAIGGTWAHAGVAELYTRIKNNGYKMVYLSSRAIGQSHTTKQYLKSIAQDSKQLPDGPVLLSPTSIITAFRREVIERRPEEFKIAALTDLKQLFPSSNPFYAGFGNRITDVVSYDAVAVTAARILIIDPSGKVKRSDSVGLELSYKSMATDTVDYMFPPLSVHIKDDVRKTERLTSTWSKPLEHSNFTHWHVAPNDVLDDDLKEYEEQRKKMMAKQKAKK